MSRTEPRINSYGCVEVPDVLRPMKPDWDAEGNGMRTAFDHLHRRGLIPDTWDESKRLGAKAEECGYGLCRHAESEDGVELSIVDPSGQDARVILPWGMAGAFGEWLMGESRRHEHGGEGERC